MTLFELVLRFVTMFGAAIMAGGQTAVLLVIMPTKRKFEPRMSVAVHTAMLGRQIDRYMKPAVKSSGLSAIAILVLQGVGVFRCSTISTVFTAIGIAGMIGVVITSKRFNIPMNEWMATWSLDAIPDDYPNIRRKWDLVHTIRTSCGVLAMSAYMLAALVRCAITL